MHDDAKGHLRSAADDFVAPVTRVQRREFPAQYTERLPMPAQLAGHDPLRVLAMRKHYPEYAR